MCLCINRIIGCIIFAGFAAVECKKDFGRVCREAFYCTHSRNQKCAINKAGKYKRFWDSCDMLKYNCEHREEYVLTYMEACKHLPILKKKLVQPWEQFTTTTRRRPSTTTVITLSPTPENFNEYWCSIANTCYIFQAEQICGKDHRLNRYRVFLCDCTMARFNCDTYKDYRQINVPIGQCLKLIKKQNTPKILRFLGNFNISLESEPETQRKSTTESSSKESEPQSEAESNLESQLESESQSDSESEVKSEMETKTELGPVPVTLQVPKRTIKPRPPIFGQSYSEEDLGLRPPSGPFAERDINFWEGWCEDEKT